MKNDIEGFVKKNRSDFDDLSPKEEVWDGIENNIPGKRQSVGDWLWKAAAVIFFCTSTFLYLNPTKSSNNESIAQITTSEDNLLNKELAQVESYYIEMISAKRSLITTFQEGDNAGNNGVDFEEDLQKLDAMYEVLKKQFDDNPSEEVVDALVLNLLVRIDILNKKLAELDVDKVPLGARKKDVNV